MDAAWIRARLDEQPAGAHFDLVLELTPKRWVILTVNDTKRIVTIHFLNAQETFIRMRGGEDAPERMLMFAQSELEVPRRALLDRDVAAVVAAAAVRSNAAMIDVDRWAELVM